MVMIVLLMILDLKSMLFKRRTRVYSARYAGEQRNADDNMNKVLENLADINNRKAQQNRNSTKHQRKATSFTGIAPGEIT
jgi:XTP/dITP diphosphohydrolase